MPWIVQLVIALLGSLPAIIKMIKNHPDGTKPGVEELKTRLKKLSR